MAGVSAVYQSRASEDAWCLLPASGLAGTFGAGVCGTYHPSGPTGTASAGSTTSMTTTLTLKVSLAGYKFRVTAGTGKGQEAIILSNTVGANSVITFAALGTGLNATSVFLLLTGRFYFIVPLATPGFRYWDHATQSWSAALVVTGLTITVIDGRLVGTPGFTAHATGTATSATATTISNAAKAWTASQWINFQVRITGGTGAGQVHTITANTGVQLTVAAWTITPDATSTYVIEGNEDHLYFIGNNATAIFRYSISGNSWSTMTARAGASAAGATLCWAHNVSADDWTDENEIKNGRRLYSFRGGAVSTLDYYDIPSNTWTSAVAYSPAAETFTAGSSSEYDQGNFIYIQKDGTGRWFRYDLRTDALDGWFTNLYTQGAAVVGDKVWTVTYEDGATTLRWLYQALSTSQIVMRVLVI
jgi:hypothetical protein